jgi:hypothetical protein
MPVAPYDQHPRQRPFADCASQVRRLHQLLLSLEQRAAALALPPLAGREWFELLERKLMPQLGEDPYVVAAVVGGTNIGKSVVFNHLAGSPVSATSPLASGTRHPVCLVPVGFPQRHDLCRIFPGFELHPWREPDAALEDVPAHRLFWKECDTLPGNLLVLDTPDIDSDAVINWHRADCIRHAADVLIAVLTQQKYNDAAVKRFFRNAAREDKAVIVLFNQCQLPEDEQWWPRWLETFSRETAIDPEGIYVAPADRRGADELRLPFWRRHADGRPAPCSSSDLRQDLSGLQFDKIKLRTLRGSLQSLLSDQQGAPAWLKEVGRRARAFDDAHRLLALHQLAKVNNWPPPPIAPLVAGIRLWWREQRQGFARAVHNAYGAVGQHLTWPLRWARDKLVGAPADPIAAYRAAEHDAMLLVIEKLYEELGRLCELGNDLLRPRLVALLAGNERTCVLKRLRDAHEGVDLAEQLASVVDRQMQQFRRESPATFGLLRKLDTMAAAARPLASVVMFIAAAGPVGHALVPAMGDAAAQSLVVHIMGDIAGGTGAVVVGETALSGTAGGLRLLEARFRQLQSAFMAERVAWFAKFLGENVLGRLPEELHAAAAVVESPEYRETAAALAELAGLLEPGAGEPGKV